MVAVPLADVANRQSGGAPRLRAGIAIHELGESIGQYNMYRDILSEIESDRELYLAVPSFTYDGIFSEPLGQLLIRKEYLKLIVFEETKERIRQWIS